MSFSGRTPESLLPRSDSKNPATTCKGLTANGRPCRRGLANSAKSSPVPSPSRETGVLALLNHSDTAAFYCWQHQDQVEHLGAREDLRTVVYPLKEKSSIDTLIDRVGVLNLDEEVNQSRRRQHRRKQSDEQHLTKRDSLPAGWRDLQSPLMTVPEETLRQKPARRYENRYGQSNVKASWSCCIRADDDDLPPPRRHQSGPRPRPDPTRLTQPSEQPIMYQQSSKIRNDDHSSTGRRVASNGRTQPSMSHLPNWHSHAIANARPVLSTQPPLSKIKSQTDTLLSLFPSKTSPQTTSQLLTELSRPVSSADDAGYIYMFWLTPESENSKPDDETASSLIDSPDSYETTETSPAHNRELRATEALNRYASVRKTPSSPRTITLKIGRATNVHRRLSQWSKQCGQNITLIRFYPYTSPSDSTATATNSTPPKKVPHVHRVERLIHIELAEKRLRKSECEQCGREHREWFEIPASKTGLREVDELIRRWVTWAEGVGSGG